jgi:regulator of replication initiation timing
MKDGVEKLSEIAKHSDTLQEFNLIEVNDRDTTENDSFSKNNYITSRMYYFVIFIATNNFIKNQYNESVGENHLLQTHNYQLQGQLEKYEEMLAKMNKEYEKLLQQNTKNDQITYGLRQDFDSYKKNSEYQISSLSHQLMAS